MVLASINSRLQVVGYRLQLKSTMGLKNTSLHVRIPSMEERKGGRFRKPGIPDLGERITNLMSDLSASQLSARSEISLSYLTRIIQGEITNPTIDFVVRIGNGLGVTVSELIGQTPLPQNRDTYSPNKELELLTKTKSGKEVTIRITLQVTE